MRSSKRRRPPKNCILEEDSDKDSAIKSASASSKCINDDFDFENFSTQIKPTNPQRHHLLCDDFGEVYNKNRHFPITDLAIHKKKIEEVKQWLATFAARNTSKCSQRPILVLSGPTGSGKSTLIHQLVPHLDIRIVEHGEHLEKGSEAVHISKFKYTPLQLVSAEGQGFDRHSVNQSSILLIDDFMPFGSCQRLLESLLTNDYTDNSDTASTLIADSTAVILVVTDPIDNHSTIWNDHSMVKLLRMPSVTHIQTNPVAATLIRRVVPRAPPQLVLQGDLRAAIINFKFLQISAKGETNFERAMADTRLDLFHALGKVLYPRKDSLENQMIDLGELWMDDRGLFLSYLQENYLHERLCLNDCVGISEIISAVDSLLSESPATATLPDRYISHLMSNRRDEKTQRSFASFRKPRCFDERAKGRHKFQ